MGLFAGQLDIGSMTGNHEGHILTPALNLEELIKEGVGNLTSDDHNGGAPGKVGCFLAEQACDRLRFGALDTSKGIEYADELGAALAGEDGADLAVGDMLVDPVGGETDGLFLLHDPIGQGSGDYNGQLSGIDVVARVFTIVQVEEDGGLEGDGGLELLDLQAADGGAGFPVDAAEGIAGGVVALAAHTGGVFKNRLMVAQGPDGRTGRQFYAGEGNYTRIDGDVIGLFFKFLHFRQAEGIAKPGGEGADRIMTAFVGAQHVLDLHGTVGAQADDPLDEAASTELDGQAFIYI